MLGLVFRRRNTGESQTLVVVACSQTSIHHDILKTRDQLEIFHELSDDSIVSLFARDKESAEEYIIRKVEDLFEKWVRAFSE